MRRVHHVRGIAGELHLYVILGFPETQGAAVHAGIRDDGLLVRGVVIHDLERCVRILFALRRPLREHQGKFAELGRRAGVCAVLKGLLALGLEVAVQVDQVVHGAGHGSEMALVALRPGCAVFFGEALVVHEVLFHIDQFHDGLCGIDDGGVIRAAVVIAAALALRGEQEVRQMDGALQVAHIAGALVFIDKDAQHTGMVLDTALPGGRQVGRHVVHQGIDLFELLVDRHVQPLVREVSLGDVRRVQAIPGLCMGGRLLRRFNRCFAGHLRVPGPRHPDGKHAFRFIAGFVLGPKLIDALCLALRLEGAGIGVVAVVRHGQGRLVPVLIDDRDHAVLQRGLGVDGHLGNLIFRHGVAVCVDGREHGVVGDGGFDLVDRIQILDRLEIDVPGLGLVGCEVVHPLRMALRQLAGLQDVQGRRIDAVRTPFIVQGIGGHGRVGRNGHQAAGRGGKVPPEMRLLAAQERGEELVVVLRIALQIGVEAQVQGELVHRLFGILIVGHRSGHHKLLLFVHGIPQREGQVLVGAAGTAGIRDAAVLRRVAGGHRNLAAVVLPDKPAAVVRAHRDGVHLAVDQGLHGLDLAAGVVDFPLVRCDLFVQADGGGIGKRDRLDAHVAPVYVIAVGDQHAHLDLVVFAGRIILEAGNVAHSGGARGRDAVAIGGAVFDFAVDQELQRDVGRPFARVDVQVLQIRAAGHVKGDAAALFDKDKAVVGAFLRLRVHAVRIDVRGLGVLNHRAALLLANRGHVGDLGFLHIFPVVIRKAGIVEISPVDVALAG